MWSNAETIRSQQRFYELVQRQGHLPLCQKHLMQTVKKLSLTLNVRRTSANILSLKFFFLIYVRLTPDERETLEQNVKTGTTTFGQ